MWNDFQNTPQGQQPPRKNFMPFPFGKRGEASSNENQVGLKPGKGWRQRNLKFINDILIPHFLAPRQPGIKSSLLPGLHWDQVAITWLGHAGFLVQMGGRNILIDPNWALWHGPVKRVRHPSLSLSELPYIDLVLVTHAHFDHLHLPSLRAVAAGQPIVVPQGVGSIVKGCAFSKVIELDYWKSVNFDGLEITLTPTKHWGARYIHDTYRKFGGYLIGLDGQTIFHCGDSSMFDGFQDIAKRSPVDIALMPIGAYQAPSGRAVHMNPEEALAASDMMGARHLIPMHYATFPLGGEPMSEPAVRLREGALRLGIQDNVHILPEGTSALFNKV